MSRVLGDDHCEGCVWHVKENTVLNAMSTDPSIGKNSVKNSLVGRKNPNKLSVTVHDTFVE